MIQPTTALRKIAQLKKRIWVIQGGQGAGKTFAILLLIINYAKRNPNKEIFIASAELSKMRITVIKDFVKILKELDLFQTLSIADTLFRFNNGSFVKFIGLDKEDVGKGLRSDLIFVNEANKVSFETFRELTSRAKRVILDFNPNGEFWAHTEIIPRDDAEFLILTYKDNEFLSYEELREIERYRTNAFINPDITEQKLLNDPANIKSKYWKNKWDIYGCGIIGTNPNRIFFWDEVPDAEYHKLDVPKYYGVDWGVVDPWGILECKYYDGALYFHELNYASENEIRETLTYEQKVEVNADQDRGVVRWKFNQLNIPTDALIVCDDNRPIKIQTLHEMGYTEAFSAIKGAGSIIDGINQLNNMTCYYTASSKNLKFEQENYSRKVDRYGVVLEEPEDQYNHLCFSGDTIIETINGGKRIDSITSEDKVLTRYGYRDVVWAWSNGLKQTFKYLMQFDTFSISLVCTPDHRINTNSGWIEISKLEPGMMVSHIRHLTGEPITSMQANDILEKIDTACIGMYGNPITVKEKKDFISTIKTITRGIMNLITWKKNQPVSTYLNTLKSDLKITQSGQKNFTQEALNQQKNGTIVKKAINGTKSKGQGHGSAENINPNIVRIVERNIKPDTQETRNTVITTARLLRLEKGEEIHQEVYDLTVDGVHEYFANGVLVHNCDPSRYIVTFLVFLGIIKPK
jgi:phage terminase large subunit